MPELTSYSLTGVVAILLVAFCFACKDESISSDSTLSSSPIYDADLRHPKRLEKYAGIANCDTAPRIRNTRGP
jgi:hypothetical protein